MTKLGAIFFLFVCVMFVSAENKPSAKKQLIAKVKHALVSKLDPALPSIAFEQWLRTEAGADARYEWEVNDCGEQAGVPGQNGAEIPTCVEADAWLTDGREILIMISVPQRNNAPVKGKENNPAVFFAQLITTREKITLKQLSDLPAALVRSHEPHKSPEIAT